MIPTQQELEEMADDTSKLEIYSSAWLESFAARIIAWHTEQLRKQALVYLFRRKGLDDFCTCDKRRYEELEKKRNLFEVKKLYAHPQPAPEGWQLVPKEATEEMIKAIRYASSFTFGYRAMLAAAPAYKEE